MRQKKEKVVKEEIEKTISLTRKVKCRACGISSQRLEMAEGKKGYYHCGECYDNYLIRENFIERELSALDDLYYVVKDVHDLDETCIVPKSIMAAIQDLRNGNVNSKGVIEKRYKNGVPYSIIKEAYILAKSEFLKKKATKNDFTGDLREFRYVLAIVVNKINEIAIKRRRENNVKRTLDKLVEPTIISKEFVENIQRKKQEQDEDEKIDLTTLLD